MNTSPRRSRLTEGSEAAPRSKATDNHNGTGIETWARRSAEACRTVQLDCGCGPDPWLCHCTQPCLSERMIDAGRDAALHILAEGRTPILKLDILRALWRRGGKERALAERLADATLPAGQLA